MNYDLDETTVEKLPFLEFRKWYSNAIMNNVQDANAMTLCTVNKHGLPSSRIVYMRDQQDDGLVFFTNYRSRKALEIEDNHNVCCSFFWQPLGRQIRIEGMIEKINPVDSSDYFSIRPRGSQIGAWASAQSSILNSRKELESRFTSLSKEFEGREVPRPDWWGGYKIKPRYFEFWLGRDSRLHDRICYHSNMDSTWKIERLSP